jgi:hypothetical protein
MDNKDTEEAEEPALPPEKKEHPAFLPKDFLDEIQALPSSEQQVERILDFMQRILEAGGGHQFSHFWEARKLCLEGFKQTIYPTSRVKLWARYSDLCREARKLKELFDEQSSFVTEQIEKAIEAIELEISKLPEHLSSLPPIELLSSCKFIHANLLQYNTLQNELNYLNSFASRASSLRKELTKAEMRVKQKNRLFHRLSILGDLIYPRRKAVIQQVSSLFLSDVEEFIRITFDRDLKTHELFEVKEEIKQLQGIAKVLTLSTEVFTKVRLQLSESWDGIQKVVKERKQVQHEQRLSFRKHREEIQAELEKIAASVEKKEISPQDARKSLRDIAVKMRGVTLAHNDVRSLRDRLREIEQTLEQKAPVVSPQAPVAKDEKDRSFRDFLRRAGECRTIDDVNTQEEVLLELEREALDLSLSRSDRLDVDRHLLEVRGCIEMKRREHLASLSEEALQDLDILRKELLSLEHLRADVKHQLESWRRATGGSGIDLAQAMRYTELIEEERARLSRLDALISDLEERTDKLSCDEC